MRLIRRSREVGGSRRTTGACRAQQLRGTDRNGAVGLEFEIYCTAWHFDDDESVANLGAKP